jgi:ubiquinone biosynthesis protein UbiJ
MNLPPGLARALAGAINRYLALDPAAMTRLAELAGRSVALELRGLDLTLQLRIETGGIRILEEPLAQPDTVLRGTPLGFARLGLGGSTAGPLFTGDVSIEGDIETGQAFKAVLDELDIDWEEQLAGITGDFLAHRLGNAARAAANWLQHGRRTLEADTGEYVTEELRIVPTRIELENFSADVDRLRMDMERLAARIARLAGEGR